MKQITATVKTIPRSDFERIRAMTDVARDYRPADDALIATLTDAFPNADPRNIVTLWHSLMKDKVIRSFPSMMRKKARLLRAYAHRNIETVAADYDLAPCTLLRVLLSDSYPSETISQVFVYGKTSLLTRRDRAQFQRALLHDFDPRDDPLAKSLAAEDKWVSAFTTLHNLPHRVQDDLVAEQKAAYGRAVATPDLLLHDPIVINGNVCKWIDYKDYVGADIGFLAKSNTAQCARYVAMWGPGALVYHAVVEGWELPGVVMLSADELLKHADPYNLANSSEDTPDAMNKVATDYQTIKLLM
jgi:hypothetical protein